VQVKTSTTPPHVPRLQKALSAEERGARIDARQLAIAAVACAAACSRPVIDRTYRFDEIVEAHRYSTAAARLGVS
jgi:hypothetical protein